MILLPLRFSYRDTSYNTEQRKAVQSYPGGYSAYSATTTGSSAVRPLPTEMSPPSYGQTAASNTSSYLGSSSGTSYLASTSGYSTSRPDTSSYSAITRPDSTYSAATRPDSTYTSSTRPDSIYSSNSTVNLLGGNNGYLGSGSSRLSYSKTDLAYTSSSDLTSSHHLGGSSGYSSGSTYRNDYLGSSDTSTYGSYTRPDYSTSSSISNNTSQVKNIVLNL